MDRAAEAARLAAIRRRVGLLGGHEWLLGSFEGRMQVDARGPDGSLVTILTFAPQADGDEIQTVGEALSDLRFLLSLVERACVAMRRRTRDARPPPAQDRVKPNHAAEAAMLCGEPAFKRFLIERHGLESPATDERATQKLRGLLGVTSRSAINEDDTVRSRWLDLRREFHEWKGRARV